MQVGVTNLIGLICPPFSQRNRESESELGVESEMGNEILCS